MPNVNNPLSGTHKTNITGVETAINTALGNLNNPNDSVQRAAYRVLVGMRKDLDQLKVERAS